MTKEPKPAVYLAATLALEIPGEFSPYKAATDAEKLVTLGKRATRLAVQRCNGIWRYDTTARRVLPSWTEQDEARAEKTAASIMKQATDILGPYGATGVSVDGDPRGFVLKFRLASGRSNSFGGDVWGV
ncbi:MAG: hypothetical protein EOS72_03140 [Mesorhizobium sp.]|uniref:hypothetical protein n=1 Tax=Mesorhizobium sp. TaxID=1871066 RepID=UPI000FEA0033|nr:hypothetical protein [Mesorhizobium sp.]RWC91664.1 MAG: hypothetical protein EOS72_03140 [Mesorhizobium sp.]